MKTSILEIGFQTDSSIKFNNAAYVELVNSIASVVHVTDLSAHIDRNYVHSQIDYESESARLGKLCKRHKLDFIEFVTTRPYRNNYFTYESDKDMVLSIAHWEHYTNVPAENGVLYFLSGWLAHFICPGVSHKKSTGCVHDFLWNKADVDRCMKTGFICNDCQPRHSEAIVNDPFKQSIEEDLIKLLDVVSTTSKWGKSVFQALTNKELSELTPELFEDSVADYYRSVGANVQQNLNIAGFQIDVFASEHTASGESVRSVIECKFYQEKVGNRLVNDFARIVATIKEAEEGDRGIIVAYSGFTQDAYLAAKHTGIRLVHYKDLKIAPRVLSNTTEKQPKYVDIKQPSGKSLLVSEPLVFVIMPFSSEFDDLYYYGIRGGVQKCGAACTRTDQLHFTGEILEEIYKLIETSRFIVAEVSQPNANVFYELGFAHALKKTVILLTRDASKIPFDISGFNHIVYKSIADLEQKLSARLNVLLTPQRNH